MTSYCMISSNRGLDTFQRLSKTYHLENCDFFRYLQMRHHFKTNIKTIGERGMHLIKIFIDAFKGNSNRKLISKIYPSLQLEMGLSTLYVKTRWEKEANIALTEDDWLNICRTMCTTSSSDLWREYTWKNLLRFFITPKIKKSQSNNP